MTECLEDSKLLHDVSYHVSLPPKLPQKAPDEDRERDINYCLILLVLETINSYQEHLTNGTTRWSRISRMLARTAKNLDVTQDQLQTDMKKMKVGAILALHVRQQNACIIVRKLAAVTIFEVFEAQAPNSEIMSNPGKLVRHFPGPAIQVANSTVKDAGFIFEVSNFLSHMHMDTLEDAQAKATKAGSKISENRDSADPHYISRLFVAILRGFGQVAETCRVVKRIADEVLWDDAYLPWRRSPVWLLIRVALQTSLDSTDTYKHFMAYFHAYLLHRCSSDPHRTTFSSDHLFAMRAKMAYRLHKIGDRAPSFVVQMAKRAGERTERRLRARWAIVQANIPVFGALTINAEEAMAQTLPNSRGYITQVLGARSSYAQSSSFRSQEYPRIINGVDLSAFTGGALATSFARNKHVALYDFEHAVHYHLSAWTETQIHSGNHSAQDVVYDCLGQYLIAAQDHYLLDVADRSIMILTVLELWVALDRLVASEQSLILEYSPKIPDTLIESLLLWSSKHLQRADAVQNHLHHRENTSHRGSIFEDRATSNLLPVQFFDRSSTLQLLKNRIEQMATRKRNEKIAELNQLNETHRQLQEEIFDMVCDKRENQWGRSHHKRKKCPKCKKADQADGMRIDRYEWPLPVDE